MVPLFSAALIAGCATRGVTSHDSPSIVASRAAVAGDAKPATRREPPPGNRAARARKPIVIDSGASEVFTPLDRQPPRAALTAVQAWARWDRLSGGHRSHWPRSITTWYGILTLPPQYPDRRVYAFSTLSGCVTTLPQARPLPRCREWTFLDIHTAEQIETTWQRLR